MDKFLAVLVLLSLVLAVTSNTDDDGEKRGCAMRAGSKGGKCGNNVSFIKRFYDAYKRGQAETDRAADNGWENIAAERRAEEMETVEEKIRLLEEVLNELKGDARMK